MSLRNRATPAAYTLTDSLAELERTDPAVAKAAVNLDRATTWPVIDALNANGTRWRADEPRGNTYLWERHEALTCALTRPLVATHEEAAELVSTANMRGASRQAVMAKAAGTKSKRAMGERIARAFKDARPLDSGNAFAVVVITRIAPRLLDSDNLEGACKALRDGIATGLGIDDRSSRVRYVTTQEQGAPRYCAVRAELFIQPKENP